MVARLPHKIAFAGLVSLGGLLYIFGGCRNRNGVPNERSDERQLWVYDPAAAALTAGPSMRVARQECAGACLGGRVYAFGGAACRERGPYGAATCYPGRLPRGWLFGPPGWLFGLPRGWLFGSPGWRPRDEGRSAAPGRHGRLIAGLPPAVRQRSSCHAFSGMESVAASSCAP